MLQQEPRWMPLLKGMLSVAGVGGSPGKWQPRQSLVPANGVRGNVVADWELGIVGF